MKLVKRIIMTKVHIRKVRMNKTSDIVVKKFFDRVNHIFRLFQRAKSKQSSRYQKLKLVLPFGRHFSLSLMIRIFFLKIKTKVRITITKELLRFLFHYKIFLFRSFKRVSYFETILKNQIGKIDPSFLSMTAD